MFTSCFYYFSIVDRSMQNEENSSEMTILKYPIHWIYFHDDIMEDTSNYWGQCSLMAVFFRGPAPLCTWRLLTKLGKPFHCVARCEQLERRAVLEASFGLSVFEHVSMNGSISCSGEAAGVTQTQKVRPVSYCTPASCVGCSSGRDATSISSPYF